MLPGQEWVAKEFVLFIHERILQREASKGLAPSARRAPPALYYHRWMAARKQTLAIMEDNIILLHIWEKWRNFFFVSEERSQDSERALIPLSSYQEVTRVISHSFAFFSCSSWNFGHLCLPIIYLCNTYADSSSKTDICRYSGEPLKYVFIYMACLT